MLTQNDFDDLRAAHAAATEALQTLYRYRSAVVAYERKALRAIDVWNALRVRLNADLDPLIAQAFPATVEPAPSLGSGPRGIRLTDSSDPTFSGGIIMDP